MQHDNDVLQEKTAIETEKVVKSIKSLSKSKKPTELKLSNVIKRAEKLPVDNMMAIALIKAGMTPENVASMLLELCNWQTTKIDKNGNTFDILDGNLRIKALDLWSKLTGVGKTNKQEVHNHLHAQLSEDKIDALTKKIR